MGAIASQIISLTIVYSTIYSDTDQRKHQGSASLAFVRGIHRRPVNSPHKWPVSWNMFPFDDVIMSCWCVGSFPRHWKSCILAEALVQFFLHHLKELTYWHELFYYNFNTLRPRQNGRHFADDMFKSISLNENVCEFRLKFLWSLFLRVQLTIIQHCFRSWLGAVQATSHYLNQWWLVLWCIYASLGFNELTWELQFCSMLQYS